MTARTWTVSSLGRCEPVLHAHSVPYVAVRASLELAKVYASIADHATARHLLREMDDILLRRPALGALVDEVSSFAGPHVERPCDGGRRDAPARRSFGCFRTCRPISRSARSGSGCSCLATPSARKSAPSIGNWASPHAAVRCNRRRRSVCSAGSQDHPADVCSNASLMSYPSAIARLGAAATTLGSPTTEATPTSTSTISAAVAPALTAASVSTP